MSGDDSTRNKIMAAAWEVFVEKGYDGARMQEIANRAGANKAMIYYYFNSKDALFEAIIRETFGKLLSAFQGILSLKDIDIVTKIRKIVHTHLSFLSKHPHLVRLFLREIHSDNPIVHRVLQELYLDRNLLDLTDAIQEFQKAIDAGIIRPVDPVQTLWNFIGLDLFYFIARPMLVINWKDKMVDEQKLIREREESIVDLLLYGLLPR